ncbi:MAG: hypothetical protein PHQ28_00805 [Mycobacterium sp.]|nr:hypothetical protein [Mycobacterium sp.]
MGQKVTTVSVYLGGSQKSLDQPGFRDRLRELIVEFGGPEQAIIAIEESEI